EAASRGLSPREFYEVGVEGALCDELTKAALRAIGDDFDWASVEATPVRGWPASHFCAGSVRPRYRDCPQGVAGTDASDGALLVQHGHDLLVQVVGAGRIVRHRGQARAAVLAEGAHHVEDDPDLPRLVEVQASANDEVEEVVGRQLPVCGALDVVGRDEV